MCVVYIRKGGQRQRAFFFPSKNNSPPSLLPRHLCSRQSSQLDIDLYLEKIHFSRDWRAMFVQEAQTDRWDIIVKLEKVFLTDYR